MSLLSLFEALTNDFKLQSVSKSLCASQEQATLEFMWGLCFWKGRWQSEPCREILSMQARCGCLSIPSCPCHVGTDLQAARMLSALRECMYLVTSRFTYLLSAHTKQLVTWSPPLMWPSKHLGPLELVPLCRLQLAAVGRDHAARQAV